MKNKIGSLFLVSILALAGIGVSYAGFFDEIYVSGYVETGTVTLELEDYSCTWVWKWWNDNNEDGVFINHDWCDDMMDEAEVLAYCNSEFGADYVMPVAWANSSLVAGTDDEVYVSFENIFPCIDFVADFVFHYTGTIPAKIDNPTINFAADFPEILKQYVVVEFYEFDEATGAIGSALVWPVQVHFCDYIYVKVIIHLAQNNLLQGLSGDFDFTLTAIQWYDCD